MATYRLKLERESDGQVVTQWGGLRQDQVNPLIAALKTFAPWLARAARAKRAVAELTELLGPGR